MKRKAFILTATCATALALSACGAPASSNSWDDDSYSNRDTAVCTDKKGKRVPDRYCQRSSSGFSSAFMWYYIGANSRMPYYGDTVRGGSYKAKPGTKYFYAPKATTMTRAAARSAAISRGGMGSSAKSSFSSAGRSAAS